METNMQQAVFGGGCFWCTEAVFQRLRGVSVVMPGYAGGSIQRPTYEQVSSGTTGHAEVIRIEYDPSKISFSDLLSVFFATHNPTELNRQGADVGTQYRSVVFYETEEQKTEAEQFIQQLEQEQVYDKPIVTEVKPLTNFFEAENYHKNYYNQNANRNPYCQVVINPKLAKLKEKFAELLISD